MKNHIKLYEIYTREELKNFKAKEKIRSWIVDNIDTEDIEYIINHDLTVDVSGDVSLPKSIKFIPFQFGVVKGDFGCYGTKIKTLKGCPIEVTNEFDCSFTKLSSLCYIPKKYGYCVCSSCGLTSLVFAPKEIWNYNGNPCTEIYDRLGFTTEAHVESLLTLDPDWRGTLELLKIEFPKRHKELLKDKRLRIELGLESNDITLAYKTSKEVEGDFY